MAKGHRNGMVIRRGISIRHRPFKTSSLKKGLDIETALRISNVVNLRFTHLCLRCGFRFDYLWAVEKAVGLSIAKPRDHIPYWVKSFRC